MRRHDEWGRKKNRRRAQREPLAREAYFGSGNIDILPQSGHAIDVSRDGVLIRTARPLPEGTAIEVEMRPDRWQAGAQMILTRGRVARTVDRGNGDYDMGVHLHVSPSNGTSFSSPRDAKHAINDVGSLMANLRPQTVSQIHAHRSSWGSTLPRPVRFRESGKHAQAPTGWKVWRWPLAMLAAGVLLMLLWPWLLRDAKPDANLKRHPANSAFEPIIREMQPPRKVEVRPTDQQDDPKNEFEEPLPETTPPVTDLAWPRPARLMVHDADYPRREANDEPRSANRDSSDSFHGRSGKQWSGYGAASGVVLDVDRRTHTMRLLVDGALREEFAIGLGRAGSTPSGEYAIGNKLTNPDWYNGGDVVRAGDPDNPIGRRWLGLAREGTLTPFGIHATDDIDSVGGNRSRGCIRVVPEDADTLFRLCPVGTRVVIH